MTPVPRTAAIRLRFLLPAVIAVAASTCATNPVTGRRELSLISESQEIAMGQEAAQQTVQSIGVVPDSSLQRYVSSLGMAMARASERPNLPWSFTVIDDPMVNAFALPGGPIFITRGILTHMNSEAQLVSVLGHEIGHITAKHSVQQMSQAQLAQIGLVTAMIVKPELAQFGDLASQGLGLLFLKFGRNDELQADDLGFRYMVNAGYAPSEMAEMFRTLGRLGSGGEGRVPQWLSTHPDPGNRVQNTLDRISSHTSLAPNLKVDRDEFLQRTEELIFGINPRQGFFRQNEFLHPDLRFHFDFPQGWQTANQATQVAAVSPQQDAIVVLSLAGTTSPDQALSQFLGQQGISNEGESSASVNGLPAAAAAFSAQTEQGVLTGRVVFVSLDGRTYRLLGYTPAQRAGAYRTDFQRSLSSFRRLTDQAALNAQPVRVKLVRLSRATTVSQFQAAYPSTIPVEQVALINGVDANATFPASAIVKQVR
ncbi:MAG TPA: M48 family metalloprotease [Gemmatimonadaceae bacterium]